MRMRRVAGYLGGLLSLLLPSMTWANIGPQYARNELVIVLEGEVKFEVAGKIHHPRAGEELLIPAGTIHSPRNTGETAQWLFGYRECQ